MTVAAVDTNVIYNIDGSGDSTSYGHILAANVTQTTNDTFVHTFDGPFESVRLDWVSEAGGTAATVDVVINAI